MFVGNGMDSDRTLSLHSDYDSQLGAGKKSVKVTFCGRTSSNCGGSGASPSNTLSI